MARIQSQTSGKKDKRERLHAKEIRESFKSSEVYQNLPQRRFGSIKPGRTKPE